MNQDEELTTYPQDPLAHHGCDVGANRMGCTVSFFPAESAVMDAPIAVFDKLSGR